MTETNLVELQTDETGDQRCGGGDGRDDLPGDLLRCMPVGRRDVVVEGAQVRSRGDEVDMEVRVVVLLELYRGETVANER